MLILILLILLVLVVRVLLVLVLLAVLAELIVLDLALFVSILVLSSLELSLLLNVLLELIICAYKSLRLSHFRFSLWIVVIIAWRTTWEVPLIFSKLLLDLADIDVTICLVDDLLETFLIQFAQVIEIAHLFVCFIDLLVIWVLIRVLFAANWEWRMVTNLWRLFLVLLVETKALGIKIVAGIFFSLVRKHLPGRLLLVIVLALGSWQVKIIRT